MDRYTYRPQKKIVAAIILVGGCFALCAALLVSLCMSDNLTNLYRTLCIILAMVGIAVTARYILPSYIYVLDKGCLTVSRVQGIKSVRVAALSLSDIDGIFGREELKLYEKQNGRIKIRRSYCQNLAARELYALVVSEDGGNTVIFLEVDESFIQQLRRRCKFLQSMS